MLQHNNALTTLLHKLCSFCEASPSYDFILSSLDENLFDGFCTGSARYLEHIPLPLISFEDSKILYFDAIQCETENIPPFADARFGGLCRFIGHLPRHISVCAEILFSHRDNVLLYAFPVSEDSANTKHLIQFVSERFKAPDASYGDKFREWRRILCHVVLCIFSRPLSSFQLNLHDEFCSMDGVPLGITIQEMTNIGIFVASGPSGGEHTLSPCMMVIITLLEHNQFLSQYNIHRFLKEMCILNIFCASGLQNEKFHSLWVKTKLTVLHVLHELKDTHCQSSFLLTRKM